MVGELNAHLLSLYPPETCYHMTAEEMAGPGNTVLVVREETQGPAPGPALGMGALRRHEDGSAEVKRMYVREAARGQGIGSAILERLEMIASSEGIKLMLLETGSDRPACAMYEKHGFVRRGPFHDYPESEHNLYYEKHLTREDAA